MKSFAAGLLAIVLLSALSAVLLAIVFACHLIIWPVTQVQRCCIAALDCFWKIPQ